MSRFTLMLLAIAGLAGLVAIGCGSDDSSEPSSADSSEEVSVVMSWFPEGEQGGYWQVEEGDLGEAVGGPKINIEPGGPSIKVTPQVASGQFDYGMADADEVLLAQSEGVPIVSVFSTFDDHLRCLMSQPDAGIESIEDIEGHPVSISQGSSFWEYLKAEYDLSDVTEQNYTGTLAQLKDNPDLVQQCYATSEPFAAEEEGIPIETLLVAESGFNPYPATIVTTEEKIKNDPEEVAKVVEALTKGWEEFLADPNQAFALIEQENQEISAEELDYQYDTLQDFIQEPLGCMDPARWDELSEQLKSVDLIESDVDPSEAFTNEFVTSDCG